MRFEQVFPANSSLRCVVSSISIPVYLTTQSPSPRPFNSSRIFFILSALSSSPGRPAFLPEDSALIAEIVRANDVKYQTSLSSCGSVGLIDYMQSARVIMPTPVKGANLVVVDTKDSPLSLLLPRSHKAKTPVMPQPLYSLVPHRTFTMSPEEHRQMQSPNIIGRF